MQSGTVFIRHFRHHGHRIAVRRRDDLQFALVAAWGRPVEDFSDSRVVHAEIELGVMEAHLYIFAAFRIFVNVVIRHREQFPPFHTEGFQRLRESILMRIVADDQERQRFTLENFIRAAQFADFPL
jgi:hypothetical protein